MVAGGNDRLRIPAVAVLWAMFAVVAAEIVATYSRIPPEKLYSVSGTGVGAGFGRALVFLNFPVALAALLLVPLARRIRAPALRLLVALYLGLEIAYGLANMTQDAWLEQVAKRGWTTHVIPSVLHPALTLPWLGIAVAAAAFAALILRPAPARRSGRHGPRTPSSPRARPGAARDA